MVIFDSTRRRVNRQPFARGLVAPEKPASKPAARAPYTAADLAFWAENAPSNATGYDVVGLSDAELERRAGESDWYNRTIGWEPQRKGTPVRLDATEEVARRYNLSPATVEEHNAAWDAYDAWQAAVSKWLDGRGPHPDTVA